MTDNSKVDYTWAIELWVLKSSLATERIHSRG